MQIFGRDGVFPEICTAPPVRRSQRIADDKRAGGTEVPDLEGRAFDVAGSLDVMGAHQVDERGVIVACASCGQRNRVPFSGAETRCGRCKTAIPPIAEPVEIPSAAAFDNAVSQSSRPVVVDFWAPWCGPCRMVAPELARVAASNAGRYLVVKVNTDAVPELGERFGIRSIPTMAVFQGGREVGRTTGARPAAEIEAFVTQSTAR